MVTVPHMFKAPRQKIKKQNTLFFKKRFQKCHIITDFEIVINQIFFAEMHKKKFLSKVMAPPANFSTDGLIHISSLKIFNKVCQLNLPTYLANSVAFNLLAISSSLVGILMPI